MNIRRFLVFYRLPIALVVLALGFWMGFAVSWWGAVPLFIIGLLIIVAHFMIGPITLIQQYMEAGDVEGAQKLLDRIKYPNLLYKPVRSSYYMLRANMSGMSQDLDKAESDLRKGLATGMPEKQFEGSAYLQLGSIALQKGNSKEAFENLSKAVKLGLPDKDSEAFAYITLCSIAMQRRNFKGAKMYFNKAKNSKATNEQVLDQIKEMQKYIARMPG